MARILVTGSTGCIGSAAVDWLLTDGVEEVVGLNRSDPPAETNEPNLRFLQGDIAEDSRLREVLPTRDP